MVASKILVASGGPKKSKTATSTKGKTAKYYPADDVSTPRASRKSTKNAPKTRSSIVPGAVVILLSGRHRGKRAVCLKVLPSGLLLITGPFKVNGVPLKRVNAAYVIATSTKIDVSKVAVPASITDSYFAKVAPTGTAAEEKFFTGDKSVAVVTDQRKKDQKSVDAGILKAIAGTTMMKQYLGSRFSLTDGDRVHSMVF